MIEAVLFDLGDSLLNLKTTTVTRIVEIAGTPAHQWLVKTDGDAPPLSKFLRALKRRLIWAYVLSRVTRSEVQLGATVEKTIARFGIHLDADQLSDILARGSAETQPLFAMDDDALPVVRHLEESGYKLGIVSNTWFPSPAIEDLLDREGLLGFFPVSVYSSEVRFMKPNQRIYHMALDKIGVPAERTVFIGDRVDNDIRGPAGVGMKTILYAKKNRPPRGVPAATHVIRRLTEVPELLANGMEPCGPT